MNKIKDSEFVNLLETNIPIYKNLEIEISFDLRIDLSKISGTKRFVDCKFMGSEIKFFGKNENNKNLISFIFEKCEFKNRIVYENASLNIIEFIDLIESTNEIEFIGSEISILRIYNTIVLANEIVLNDNTFLINLIACIIGEIYIKKVNSYWVALNILGGYHFRDKFIKEEDSYVYGNCTITESNINKINIEEIDFRGNKNIIESNQINYAYFYHCNLNNISFKNSNFLFNSFFQKIHFNGEVNYIDCQNLNNTELKFVKCSFESYSYFNRAKLNYISFNDVTFHEMPAFQNMEVNTIVIERTNFKNGAYFDDLIINQINSCSRRTIRTIKQQLLRLDNKIDFNKYRSEELKLYKKELATQFKNSNFKNRIKILPDIFTLNLGSFFSNFGTNPIKSIIKTISVGFLFYCLFYITYGCMQPHEQLNNFWSGFFRFFLITDFKNPFSSNGEYLSNIQE